LTEAEMEQLQQMIALGAMSIAPGRSPTERGRRRR
jgi:hypothetical protein